MACATIHAFVRTVLHCDHIRAHSLHPMWTDVIRDCRHLLMVNGFWSGPDCAPKNDMTDKGIAISFGARCAELSRETLPGAAFS